MGDKYQQQKHGLIYNDKIHVRLGKTTWRYVIRNKINVNVNDL